jgi:hypothetical protein
VVLAGEQAIVPRASRTKKGPSFDGLEFDVLVILDGAAIPAPLAAVFHVAPGRTVQAAPIMLGIRDVSAPAALQHAFESFWNWGNLRAVCQVLAFPAQLGSLAMLLRSDRSIHR